MSDEATFFLGFCALAFLIFFSARYLVYSSNKKLGFLAERLDFQFIPQGFFKGIVKQVIEGSHRDRSIRLEKRYVSSTDEESLGPSHNTRVILSIVNPMGYSLSVQTIGSFIRKPKRIPVGEPNFDRQFILRCNPVEIAEQIFKSTGLAQRLMEVNPVILKVINDQMVFEKGGFEMDGARESYFLLFDLLCDLAEAFEGVRN